MNYFNLIDYYFQASENAKNNKMGRVLTQGDKLNLIKARKQLSPVKNLEEKSENNEKIVEKPKISSTRTVKPNMIPKRDGSTANTRLITLFYFRISTGT